MSLVLDITPEQRRLLLELLGQFLPHIKVWAFGSRVKGTARVTSDLDLVVFSEPTQREQVSALQEACEESALPFKVDILVWNEIPENFKVEIQRHFIELINPLSS